MRATAILKNSLPTVASLKLSRREEGVATDNHRDLDSANGPIRRKVRRDELHEFITNTDMTHCATDLRTVIVMDFARSCIRCSCGRSLMPLRRKQGQRNSTLDILAGGFRQMMDVPHDHFMASAIARFLCEVRPVRVQGRMPCLLQPQALKVCMPHVPRISRIAVHVRQFWRSCVEERSLRVVKQRG